MATRVVGIDDDDISRRGLGELLSDHPDIDVAGMLTHHGAMLWDGDWSAVDVVVVGAADGRRADDSSAGVNVVDHVRQASGSRDPMIIVVAGPFFGDPEGRRLWEDRADFFYHRAEVQDAASLHAAVLRTDRGSSLPRPGELGQPGRDDPRTAT